MFVRASASYTAAPVVNRLVFCLSLDSQCGRGWFLAFFESQSKETKHSSDLYYTPGTAYVLVNRCRVRSDRLAGITYRYYCYECYSICIVYIAVVQQHPLLIVLCFVSRWVLRAVLVGFWGCCVHNFVEQSMCVVIEYSTFFGCVRFSSSKATTDKHSSENCFTSYIQVITSEVEQ